MASPREEPPSPLIPVVVLIILGIMMTIPNLFTYDPDYLTDRISEVQTHFVMGALLIPVCLLLAVQAFGIPKVNPMGQRKPPSPFMQSITQNVSTSILLLVVIVGLMMLIPLRNLIQAPWHPV